MIFEARITGETPEALEAAIDEIRKLSLGLLTRQQIEIFWTGFYVRGTIDNAEQFLSLAIRDEYARQVDGGNFCPRCGQNLPGLGGQCEPLATGGE